jgi:hypothetical protein
MNLPIRPVSFLLTLVTSTLLVYILSSAPSHTPVSSLRKRDYHLHPLHLLINTASWTNVIAYTQCFCFGTNTRCKLGHGLCFQSACGMLVVLRYLFNKFTECLHL